jgi:hypothetical protein
MNLLTLTRACVLSAACLIFPRAHAVATTNENVLKVQVTAPATWRPVTGGAVEGAFVDRVSRFFAQSGLNLSVTALRPVEDGSKAPFLLSINLNDRRINPKGGVDFTFTASLQTPRGREDLGRFTSSVADWVPSSGKFDLGQPFADAADPALRQVCSEVLTTKLSLTPIARLLL